MTTAQDPVRRKKQKARRAKQLAQWRAKNPTQPKAAAETKAETKKAAPAKALEKKAAAKAK